MERQRRSRSGAASSAPAARRTWRPSRPLASDSLTTRDRRGEHRVVHLPVRRQVHDRPVAHLRRCPDRGVEGRAGISACVTRTPGPEALAHRSWRRTPGRAVRSPRCDDDGVLALRVHQDERHPCPRVRGQPARRCPRAPRRGQRRGPGRRRRHRPGRRGRWRAEHARGDRLVAALAARAHRRLPTEDGLGRCGQDLDAAELVVAVDRADHEDVHPAVQRRLLGSRHQYCRAPWTSP